MKQEAPRPQQRATGRSLRGGAVAQGALVASLLFCVLLSGTGCRTSVRDWWNNGAKVGPNYVTPPAPVAPSWLDSADQRVRLEPARDCDWWLVFNDPHLNGLIATAYRQNLDLRTAATRIIEARAQRSIAVGNLFPQSQSANISDFHANFSRNIQLLLPQTFNLWVTDFNLSWELDVWGRFRRAVESANAELEASGEDFGDVLVILMSDVAANYVQLRTFQQQLEYAKSNVEIQRNSFKLAELQFRVGTSSELDMRQARSSLEQTESLIPVYQIGARQASNALCTLLGMPTTDLAAALGRAPIPHAPPEVAVGLPADLLRRRPDVRRAERNVAAQSAEIGIAEADLYPALGVNGLIGYSATQFSELFDSRSFTAFVNPSFQWKILNYGRIVNNMRMQDARLEGLALQYQQSVLRAGQEVEDALVAFLWKQHEAHFLALSVTDASRSVELATKQFEAGSVDFNRVYILQTALVQQQNQLAITQGEIAANLIKVYKALGGGWQCMVCGPTPALMMPPGATPAPGAETVPAPAGTQRIAPPPGMPAPAGLPQAAGPRMPAPIGPPQAAAPAVRAASIPMSQLAPPSRPASTPVPQGPPDIRVAPLGPTQMSPAVRLASPAPPMPAGPPQVTGPAVRPTATVMSQLAPPVKLASTPAPQTPPSIRVAPPGPVRMSPAVRLASPAAMQMSTTVGPPSSAASQTSLAARPARAIPSQSAPAVRAAPPMSSLSAQP